MLPSELQVALKEWAVVCDALGRGRQMVLLRKGGIYESGGEFEIEHREFLLFPTYLHQKVEMLKPEEHGGLKPVAAEPNKIEISLAGEITDILPISSRAVMDSLDDQHIWTSKLIDMRFNYRPENPLYLLLIRAYRLGESVTVDNTPAYAGCKSWVPLERAIGSTDAASILNDVEYSHQKETITRRLASG
jgi:hypothetical protein